MIIAKFDLDEIWKYKKCGGTKFLGIIVIYSELLIAKQIVLRFEMLPECRVRGMKKIGKIFI